MLSQPLRCEHPPVSTYRNGLHSAASSGWKRQALQLALNVLVKPWLPPEPDAVLRRLVHQCGCLFRSVFTSSTCRKTKSHVEADFTQISEQSLELRGLGGKMHPRWCAASIQLLKSTETQSNCMFSPSLPVIRTDRSQSNTIASTKNGVSGSPLSACARIARYATLRSEAEAHGVYVSWTQGEAGTTRSRSEVSKPNVPWDQGSARHRSACSLSSRARMMSPVAVTISYSTMVSWIREQM